MARPLPSLVQRARAGTALRALAGDGDIERLEGPDGEELFGTPGASRPHEVSEPVEQSAAATTSGSQVRRCPLSAGRTGRR
ncbi:hypothetical protein ACFU6I_02465 [Streptomyces sp. NPDC057486]|uniref:hypothetical protein n=1 Tax=Streptomyces sp. NPDC057486 TaxID=3346145 RepID=UPI0036AF417E